MKLQIVFVTFIFLLKHKLNNNCQVLKFLEEEIQSFEKLFEELNGEFFTFLLDLSKFTNCRAKERRSRCKRNPHNAAFSARVEAKADSDEEGGKAKNSPEAENPAQSRPKTKCAFQSGTK